MSDSTSFEHRLSGLFDRQRFFRDPALDSLIAETDSRCSGGRALADDELDSVSAAGESEPIWDDRIRDETMLIIPAEGKQGKNLTKIILTNDTPDCWRNDP